MFNSIFFGGLFSGFENEKFYRSDRTVDKHFHGPYNHRDIVAHGLHPMAQNAPVCAGRFHK